MYIFEIHGQPVPQKQTAFNRRSGHAYNPSSKEIQFVQWQLKAYAPQEPLQGRIEVQYTFYLPIPKGTSSIRKRQMLNDVIGHTKRPDFDNLAYLITNAMKGIVYLDDSQITDAVIRKRYGADPKTVIKVIPIQQSERSRGDECA